MDARDDFEVMRSIITQTKEMTAEFNHPLMEMLKFQMRLLERAKCDDFPSIEKLRMCKIVFSNTVDILKMKFSKEKILVSKMGVNYIQNIIIPGIINIIENVTDVEKRDTHTSINRIIKPHSDGFRTYVIGSSDIYSEEEMLEFTISGWDDGKTLRDIDFIQNDKILGYLSYIDGLIRASDEMMRQTEVPEELLAKYEIYDYFEELKDKDMLFRVPKDSYQHIIDFITQMSSHPAIETLYITLYRVNTNSAIIERLKEAASLGKIVNVFIEPNARGDEDQNQRYMIDLMCVKNINVIYGIPKFKVHAKMFLAIGHNVAYGHFGTGNYNESTSKRYIDTHLLTSQGNIINPALMIFNWFIQSKNYISAENSIRRCVTPTPFDKLWMSPINVKANIIGLILGEIQKKENGRIFIKCNMLTDKEVIYYLNHAAIAGVQIDIYARSACLFDSPLCPDGYYLSNVRIYSLCGKYLEHDRIYRFGDRTFIASADLAFRNMHKRVETFIELSNDSIGKKLDEIMYSIENQYPRFMKIPGSRMEQIQWKLLLKKPTM